MPAFESALALMTVLVTAPLPVPGGVLSASASSLRLAHGAFEVDDRGAVETASVPSAPPPHGGAGDASSVEATTALEAAPLLVEPRQPPLIIGGVEVQPGERREIFLRSSESFSSGDVDVPLVVVRGVREGPVLCLMAGIHGDELNGIEIVRESLDRAPPPEELRGTLIGVPIANLFGFWNQSRYLPDRRDLNRHFPGRPGGSSAARIAHRIWNDIVKSCTHLIDFHTGSLHRSNLAQVRGDLRRPEVLRFAHAFGADTVVHNPGQRGTLRTQAVEQGIPTILYEAGETLRFQRAVIESGVKGVENIMVHLGLKSGEPKVAATPNVFLETHWVRSPQGGILELYPKLGDWVEKGDTIGVITDPLRKEKGVVKSPWSGQVIGLVLAPMVIPGIAVAHIGLPHGRMDKSEAAQEELDADRPE